jgi:hypothetical protein
MQLMKSQKLKLRRAMARTEHNSPRNTQKTALIPDFDPFNKPSAFFMSKPRES